MQSEIFQTFICYNFDVYGLQQQERAQLTMKAEETYEESMLMS